MNEKEIIDIPYGLLYVGPEDPLCYKEKIKKADIKGALKLAEEAKAQGREVTHVFAFLMCKQLYVHWANR